MSLNVTPSNAYRHALEQIGVGRREEALRTLINGMQSKRQRGWSKDHVQIMYKVNELATEQRYSVRDVYQQYHRLCQASNMDSFVELLEDYLKRVRARCDRALAQAEQANEAKVDKEADLDQTPEQLMLGLQLVDSEMGSREILTPWVKYMIEAYRTALEVVFRTPKAFRFYHQVCRESFDFCKDYERNWDFRRLCENVRYHLGRLKAQTQEAADKNRQQRVDFNDPALQALWLETRFHQLEVASAMELWQEAARSIEDINLCLAEFDAEPEAALMETYYRKLADIFWASKNYLFHAYTFREYAMLKQQGEEDQGGAPQDDPAELASAVLLAALAVPPANRVGEAEADAGPQTPHQQHLAELLGFKKDAPTRARLLTELTEAVGFLEQVNPLALRAYELLEQDFGPTTLTAELQPVLEELAQHPLLARYVEPLKETAVIRIIQLCSSVYQTLRYEKFLGMLPRGVSERRVELLLLHAARDQRAIVSIDWHCKLLRFGGIAGAHVKETADGQSAVVIHGSIDQSRVFREQLKVLGVRLQAVLDRVVGDAHKDINREQVFAYIREGASADHEAVAERLEQIERRQLSYEQARTERERRSATVKAEQQLQQQLDERQRLEEESRRRLAAQEAREKEAMALARKKQLVATLQEKVQASGAVVKVAKKLETLDIQEVDEAEIIRLGKEVLEREQQEKQRLRREAARFHEYYVRALRVEETARMVELLKERRQAEMDRVAQHFEKRMADRKQAHAAALALKRQFARIQPLQQEWSDGLIAARRETFAKARAAQEKRLAEARRQREEDRQRRQREEEERRRREEEERLRKEEEEAEKVRLREEALARQQQRLAELEERERQERERLEQERQQQQQERERQEQERPSRFGRGAASGDARPAGGWTRPTSQQQPERPSAGQASGDEPAAGGWRARRAQQEQDHQEQEERGRPGERMSRFGGERERVSRFGGERERVSRFGGDARSQDERPSESGMGFRRAPVSQQQQQESSEQRSGSGLGFRRAPISQQDSEERPERRERGGDRMGGDRQDRMGDRERPSRFGSGLRGNQDSSEQAGGWSRRAPVQRQAAPEDEAPVAQAEKPGRQQQQQQPDEAPAEPQQQQEQDDGWTTVGGNSGRQQRGRDRERRPIGSGGFRGGRGGGSGFRRGNQQ